MTDFTEISALIEKQNAAWDASKKTTDEILAAKADGKSVADLQSKLDKINAEFVEIRKDMTEVEKKAGRPNMGAEGNPDKDAYRKAFGQYLRKGKTDGLEDLSRKAMNSGADADGGFLIEETMDAAIDRVAPTIAAFYGLANVVTIGNPRYEKLVLTSGMTMRRVADGATGGETTEPKYSKVMIDVATAEVEPWVFNETLEDAFIDLESMLANEAAIGFAAGAGAEFITGNGVAKARGINSYTTVTNSAYAWGSVGYVVSGATSGFAASNPGDNIINLQHGLKAQYRPGATFVCNDATLAKIRQFKDASGNFYLWNPDPAAGFGGRILGSPVAVDDNMPDVGTGALALAYGNWKQAYTIVNRAGTTLIRDNITAKGTTKFNFRRRFGGGVVNFEAYKLMKFATS